MTEQADLHSIGEVAKATGISVDTIRVWERRYGKPIPVRIPSGHRRYTGEHIRWLRRVAEALARGNRPAKVVKLSEMELDELLSPKPEQPEASWMAPLLRAVAEERGDRLLALLQKAAAKLDPVEFVADRVAPLVTEIGRAWADGQIEIRHEHMASEVLEDFLREYRAELKETSRGPIVVLTTLPGETHRLGIQMSAIVARAGGARVRMLGADTPLPEICAAAEELKAEVVAVSVSLATGGVKTDRVLATLRADLPEEIRLVVGGRGARGVRRGPHGVEYALELREFEKVIRGISSKKRRRG
jgi:methanogenic corrinoid protein MtbC1